MGTIGTPLVRPPQIRDREDQFQRETREAISSLASGQVRKVVVRDVVLPAATTVQVPHGLGRVPVGWEVTDRNAGAVVFRDPTQLVTPDRIPLQATGAVTVTLQFW